MEPLQLKTQEYFIWALCAKIHAFFPLLKGSILIVFNFLHHPVTTQVLCGWLNYIGLKYASFYIFIEGILDLFCNGAAWQCSAGLWMSCRFFSNNPGIQLEISIDNLALL